MGMETTKTTSQKDETMASYSYPVNGACNETVATLTDGRRMHVNTQYGCVLPDGDHSDACEQVNKMGGVCNCGLLDGIDCDALIADARKHGKCGLEPVTRAIDARVAHHGRGVCPKCETYCCGDCEVR